MLFYSPNYYFKGVNKIRKYTQDEVRQAFESAGYTVLSEYKDCKTHMDLICKNGHRITKTFDTFHSHPQCPKCQHIDVSNKQRYSHDYIAQEFLKHGCVLLDRYERCHKPMRYICQCGREATICWSDFREGKRCKICGREKQTRSLIENGHGAISLQQKWIAETIGGNSVLNYPWKTSCLDIAFPEEKIYIEYDGSGHDLSVKLGSMTQEAFDRREMNRTYGLYRDGWKCIRIISRSDRLPLIDQIITMYNLALSILIDHHYVVFRIDNGTIEYDQIEYAYNFGELYRVGTDRDIKQNRIGSVTTECTCSDVCATVGSVV